jgi:TRAP-type C4-dicarboxylate transport system permease small subunit
MGILMALLVLGGIIFWFIVLLVVIGVLLVYLTPDPSGEEKENTCH